MSIRHYFDIVVSSLEQDSGMVDGVDGAIGGLKFDLAVTEVIHQQTTAFGVSSSGLSNAHQTLAFNTILYLCMGS
jgi:hypothetical protein